MRRFLLLFCLWSLLLFGALYFPFSPLYDLNAWQSSMTAAALRNILEWSAVPAAWEHDTLRFVNGSFLILTDACNGMAAFLFFAAAVMAFPAKGSKKRRWLLIGYIALFFANLLRLAGVSAAMHFDPYAYGWAHDIAGRYGYGLFMLFLYARFVSRRSEKNTDTTISPKAAL